MLSVMKQFLELLHSANERQLYHLVFPIAASYSSYIVGNSGGPAFNDQGECIGVAFQVVLC